MLYFAGPLTTLIVTPWISFDPISLPKMVALSTLSFFGAALLLVNQRQLLYTLDRKIRYSVLMFLLVMVLAIIFNDSQLQQQIFGVFGRNTGALAYLSLFLILLCAAVLQKNFLYKRLLNSLIFTSTVMTVYAIVQILGKDPVKWSQYDTFGTLGNINFLSAFFGLSTITLVALTFDKSFNVKIRSLMLIKAIIDSCIVLSTGSIQGIMMILAGIGIIGFLFIYSQSFKLRTSILSAYIMAGLGAIGLVSLGLFNKGPLAGFIFQPSVIFRGDYWHAGWALTMKDPFLGAGLDSYGDWYREVRGEISTLRTNPDRIANTAHNIFLDISSSGGLLLLAPYLFLLGLVLYRSVKNIRATKSFDPVFIALLVSWIAYQIQSLVSINQLGVGVWGFLFTGCLLGYQFQSETVTAADKGDRRKNKGRLLGAKESLMATFGLLLGFTMGAIPMSSDIAFRNARNSLSAEELLQSTESFGASLFHKELALDLILQAGEAGRPPSLQLAKRIIEDHPRSFFTWVVLLNHPDAGEETRKEALNAIRALDPFNPNYR